MKILIAAIKAALQTGLSGTVRPADIYITPHVNYIPRSVRMPCVAIADGGSDRAELLGGAVSVTAKITVVIYVDLAKEEAVIMGDAATGQKGLLDMADAVCSILDGDTLGVAGVLWAQCHAESASELFGDETAMVCRKILDYDYTMEG